MKWYQIIVPYLTSPEAQNKLIHDLFQITGSGYEEDSENRQLILYCLMEQLPDVRNILDHYQLFCSQPVSVNPLEDTDWENNWKKYIQPVQAGDFYVHPPWHQPESGKTSININPSTAFGTGSHATTRLALQTLTQITSTDQKCFLDIGTGSGILTFAAVLKGFSTAWAIDIDHFIYDNFHENIKANGLDRKNINLYIGKLVHLSLPFSFHYTIINMLPQNFQPIKEEVFRFIAPGGTLFYCGFLKEDQEEIIESLYREDFTLEIGPSLGEWGSLFMTRINRGR